MKDGLYNPDRASNTGKEIKTEPVTPANGAGVTAGTGVIDVRTKPAEEAPAETPEQIAEKEQAEITAAQKDMTDEQKAADNDARAEAKLTPEEKELKIQEKATAEKNKLAEEIKAEALKDILKEAGVTTLEELKALKNKPAEKEKTEEEKKADAETKRANVAQFAVKSKLLTMDDITAYDTLKKTDNRDLAYANFAKDYRETHKDRVDAADNTTKIPVTEAEIEDSFNEFFHLNSDNSALKKSGEKTLENYANSLKGDVEARYEDAVASFEEFEKRKQFFPKFQSFLKETINAIPAELTVGEGDKKIVVKTDKFDKAAIEKRYATDSAYDSFYAANGDQKIRDTFTKEINERLIAENINAILDVAYEVAYDAGLQKGKIGASASFDEKKVNAPADNSQKVKLTREEYKKSLSKGYANVRSN